MQPCKKTHLIEQKKEPKIPIRENDVLPHLIKVNSPPPTASLSKIITSDSRSKFGYVRQWQQYSWT